MEEIKCAVYTRKSTDEGLEKEFNTLEAQREAGENFVKSQKHQGWTLIPEHYDDGGFSGGNMNRPSLQRLLKDVAAYCSEIGIAINVPAFISWHKERGWKHGKKYVATDWQKAVRQWYCKDNELSLHEFEIALLKQGYQKELSKGSIQ